METKNESPISNTYDTSLASEEPLIETKPAPYLDVAKLLEKQGDFGNFQFKVLVYCILASVAGSLCTLILPFVMMEPDFKCRTSTGALYDCNQQHACSNEFGYELVIKMQSLVTRYEAYCDNRWMKIWGQSIIFFFSSLIAAIMPNLMERLGRKAIFTSCAIINFIVILLLFIVDDYWIIIGVFTILFATYFVIFGNFYVYSTEVFNGKWRSFANSIFYFAVYSGRLLFVFGNLFLTDTEGNYWFLLVSSIVFLPLLFLLIETPFFFNKMKKFEDLRKNLKQINRQNNEGKDEVIKENDEYIDQEIDDYVQKVTDLDTSTTVKVEKAEPLFDENLSLCKYIWLMFSITISVVPYYVLYGLIESVPYKLGINNIYVSYSLFLVVTIFINIPLMFILHKIPRKNGNILLVVMLLLCCGAFPLYPLFNLTGPIAQWSQLVITMIAAALGYTQFILICRYVNELFPTKLRVLSMSFVLIFGRMSTFIANFIDPLSEKYNVHPLSFNAVIYLFVLPFFWTYEETLNRKTLN